MNNKQPDNDTAQYIPEQRTVQILQILKQISDEFHPVTQSDILQSMKDTGDATTENPGTLSKSIDEILLRINPLVFSEENDSEFKIKYKGYKNNLALKKREIKEGVCFAKKSPSITKLFYVHDLSYDELDKIIQAVCLSSAVSADEKEKLVRSLVNISSEHYNSPYYNKNHNCLRFNPKGVYSRIQSGDSETTGILSRNLSIIQTAINDGHQICFSFNEYDENCRLRVRSGHTVSPYYIVVYHDMYYMICGKNGYRISSHFRIDLMSDIKPAVDEKGKEINSEPISRFKNLPGRENWNPEKYMREHLYMSYGEPQRIKIKLPSDRFTVLHDWFGSHYSKCKDKCEDGYEIVEVVSSPDMIVHWALQYAGTVEILNEEIRKKIREEIKKLCEKYGT